MSTLQVYTYEPFASVFAAGGVQGRVSMFFDYAVSSPVDENIDDMLNKAPSLNTQSAVGATLNLNANFMVDNTRKTKNLRLDDQSISTFYDAFDAGRLVIGLDQFTTNAEFGKLMVTYDVELLIPAAQKIPTKVGKSALIDHFYVGGGGFDWVASGGVSGVKLDIRDAWSADPANAGNVVLDPGVVPSTQSFVMEEGAYVVIMKFIKTYNAGNVIAAAESGLILDGLPGIMAASTDYVVTGPSVFTSISANGTMVVSAGGTGGRCWPYGRLNFGALAGGVAIEITFILTV